MFSVVPNILLAPNMTQNAERKHRTQDANTAHNRFRRKLHENERNWTGVARPSTSAFESANGYKHSY